LLSQTVSFGFGVLLFDTSPELWLSTLLMVYTPTQTSAPPLTRLSRLNIRRRQNVFVAAWHDTVIGRSTACDVSSEKISYFRDGMGHEGHGPITEHFHRLLVDRFINVSWQRRQLRYANSKPSERCKIHRESTSPSNCRCFVLFTIL